MRCMVIVKADKRTESGVLPNDGRTPELEIRPFFEAEDFAGIGAGGAK